MSSASVEIKTPVGLISIEALINDVHVPSSWFRKAQIQPSLPKGMSVRACWIVLLEIPFVTMGDTIQFSGRLLATKPVSDGPETGECLEAQTWIGEDCVVTLGTEDDECIRSRLGESFAVSPHSFAYSAEGLVVSFKCAKSCERATFHFTVAWNDFPESAECSCWFAAEQPHQIVIQAAANTEPRLP
jgi:hypothetical protein